MRVWGSSEELGKRKCPQGEVLKERGRGAGKSASLRPARFFLKELLLLFERQTDVTKKRELSHSPGKGQASSQVSRVGAEAQGFVPTTGGELGAS